MAIPFLLLLFIGTLIAFAGSVVIWSLRNGITPSPTTRKVRRQMLEMIPSSFGGTIVDLGSGWGHLVLFFAKRFPDAQVIGYETSPIPYWFSRLWKWREGAENAVLIQQDFYQASLKEADLVFCYLYPKGMEKVKKKLEKELKPGAVVISSTFAVPGWTPEKTVRVDDLYNTPVMIYYK